MANNGAPQKSTSPLSCITEDCCDDMFPTTSKSCDSVYSSASSSQSSAHNAYARKAPSGSHNRQAAIIPASTEVRQRVQSAKHLRKKSFQNQLADAQQTIADLTHENRILRTVHQRQDSALAKYESSNAELPQLLHSHSEQLRVWQTKHRNLQAINKDLEQKLKQKQHIILSLSDQNKYYSQLNRDKSLEDRHRLTEKLQALEAQFKEKEHEIKQMTRRMQLDAKNFKQQLLNEQKKTKDVQTKLEKARLELSGYHKLDEMSLLEKLPAAGNMRRKPSMEEGPKLEKNFDKLLFSEQPTAEDADYQPSRCSTSTRTMRRAKDRGDSKTALVNKRNKTPGKQHQQKLLKQLSSQDYDEDFEYDDLDEEETADDANETKNETNATTDADDEDLNEDGDEDEDDEEESDAIMNSAKKPKQEDISHIRQTISNEFKEREAFLDTFCRQSSVVSYDEPKKCSNPKVQPKPRVRKTKPLPLPKGMNDGKTQQ